MGVLARPTDLVLTRLTSGSLLVYGARSHCNGSLSLFGTNSRKVARSALLALSLHEMARSALMVPASFIWLALLTWYNLRGDGSLVFYGTRSRRVARSLHMVRSQCGWLALKQWCSNSIFMARLRLWY